MGADLFEICIIRSTLAHPSTLCTGVYDQLNVIANYKTHCSHTSTLNLLLLRRETNLYP